jgi:drug efflux transport system ATP-binding protein
MSDALASVTFDYDLAIEAVDLQKSFGTPHERVVALRALQARVRRRSITGLVGPDGAGKTTLLRLTAGLLIPDAGRLHVLGLDARRESARLRGRVGYMPQRFGLYEDLSVAENLELYADLYGLPYAQRSRRFAELMEFTGLGAFRTRLAGRLSGGMKQKLGLACTLVHPPELLLLDEPSVGVDPVSRRELWRIVRHLTDTGMTVVWSTAYQDEAERCDEVIILHEGRRLAGGRPAELLAPLRGRSFALVVAPAARRSAAHRAKSLPGVLDAVVQGHTVRILLADGARAPQARAVLPEAEGLSETFSPVAPRFEDVFVALLRERPGQRSPPEIAAASGSDSPTQRVGALDARPVIEIRDLSRVFGDFRAVDKVSFSVTRGEIFGLLGPNGAGKSTTFRMLCGLLPASAGEARVLGIDLRRSAPRARARIGYMSQKFSLYGLLSVEENLRFFGSAYGLDAAQRGARIAWALDAFGLEAFAERTSADLPLGFKQRLALGAALLHEPEILFLDEPTSGVDPLTRREFWDRINQLAEVGVTILVTTHFLDEAEYCDRVGIIYRGRLIALGSPDEMKQAYRRPDLPDPTLDDAFVALIEAQDQEHPA